MSKDRKKDNSSEEDATYWRAKYETLLSAYEDLKRERDMLRRALQIARGSKPKQ